jgi:ketosteroid isomerase-like protein
MVDPPRREAAIMPTQDTSDPQDAAAVIRSLFDGFNRNDLEGVVRAVTADFGLVDVPAGQTFRGPEGYRQ